MTDKEFLSEKEQNAYTDEISGVITDLIRRVITVADKYNVDRDDAMEHFSLVFATMVSVSTFEHFGEGGENSGV